jgi:hypothetical protein
VPRSSRGCSAAATGFWRREAYVDDEHRGPRVPLVSRGLAFQVVGTTAWWFLMVPSSTRTSGRARREGFLEADAFDGAFGELGLVVDRGVAFEDVVGEELPLLDGQLREDGGADGAGAVAVEGGVEHSRDGFDAANPGSGMSRTSRLDLSKVRATCFASCRCTARIDSPTTDEKASVSSRCRKDLAPRGHGRTAGIDGDDAAPGCPAIGLQEQPVARSYSDRAGAGLRARHSRGTVTRRSSHRRRRW